MEDLEETFRYIHGKEEDYLIEEDFTAKEYIFANKDTFSLQIKSDAVAIEVNVINSVFGRSQDVKVTSITRKGDFLIFAIGRFERAYNGDIEYYPLERQDYVFEVKEYKTIKRIEI